MICEKCWADAYLRSYGTEKSQLECYFELLDERKHDPCTWVEQPGYVQKQELQEAHRDA